MVELGVETVDDRSVVDLVVLDVVEADRCPLRLEGPSNPGIGRDVDCVWSIDLTDTGTV